MFVNVHVTIIGLGVCWLLSRSPPPPAGNFSRLQILSVVKYCNILIMQDTLPVASLDYYGLDFLWGINTFGVWCPCSAVRNRFKPTSAEHKMKVKLVWWSYRPGHHSLTAWKLNNEMSNGHIYSPTRLRKYIACDPVTGLEF